MSIVDRIKQQAKSDPKHILLPEGTEPRTLQAAALIRDQGIAKLTLLGDKDKIQEAAKKLGVNIDGIGIVDPGKSEDLDRYCEQYYTMRKEKGVTLEKAQAAMKDTLFFACMMVNEGKADGMVAGAINTTGDTLRPGLQIIKMKQGTSVISSCFIMDLHKSGFGENGILIFGDCAINPVPTAEQLAHIAISTAQTGRALAGIAPRVAMLSFSTKGSGKHELVDKVTEATRIAKELAPDLMIDGELQADAALVETVGKLKAPGSPVAGQANVLIFPDLQSGNIGYKLVQRLAGAEATGPISQGFRKPINDLSRGCSVEDIVSVVAITAVQAQQED
ncbi:MAG: phosphate acetyltransferase [Bacillota bacterium]